MSAIAHSIQVNLKQIKEMNEAIESTVYTLDAQTGELNQQESVQKAAYEAENKRN